MSLETRLANLEEEQGLLFGDLRDIVNKNEASRKSVETAVQDEMTRLASGMFVRHVANDGNDELGDGTLGNKYKSIAAAIDSIPQGMSGEIRIHSYGASVQIDATTNKHVTVTGFIKINHADADLGGTVNVQFGTYLSTDNARTNPFGFLIKNGLLMLSELSAAPPALLPGTLIPTGLAPFRNDGLGALFCVNSNLTCGEMPLLSGYWTGRFPLFLNNSTLSKNADSKHLLFDAVNHSTLDITTTGVMTIDGVKEDYFYASETGKALWNNAEVAGNQQRS